MHLNDFQEMEGLKVTTRQPFIRTNVRVPDILRDKHVKQQLVGKIVPVYHARDYINLEDPNVRDKAVGYAYIKNDLTVEIKLISTMMKNIIGQYKGRNFDQCFDITPSGAAVRISDTQRGFELNHFKVRDKPILHSEVKPNRAARDTVDEHAWNKEYEDDFDVRDGEIYIEKQEEFQKVLSEYIGKGKVKVRARKDLLLIEKM